MLKLIIGNRAYSSWSMRGWLAVKQSGEAFEELVVPMFDAEWEKRREGDFGHVGVRQELKLGRRFQELNRPGEQLPRLLRKLEIGLVAHVSTGWVSERCRSNLRYSHHCWAMVSILLVIQ